MKSFLSYKFSDIPIQKLHENIDPIMALLRDSNINAYCNLYDDDMYVAKGYSVKQIMDHALSNMEETDLHITFVETVVSEGMLIEFGYAVRMGLAKLVLIKTGVKSNSLRALADHVIEFEDQKDLLMKLQSWINIT